jgi:hypothetical protein
MAFHNSSTNFRIPWEGVMKIHYLLMIGLLAFTACTNTRNSEEKYFVTRIGDDTIAVESCQINANSIQGTSVLRVPRTTVQRYSMTLNNSGLPESYSVSIGPADAASQITRNYRYTNDSVEIVTTQNGTSKTNTAKVAGRPYPFSINIFGIWNYAIRHAMEMKGARQFSTLTGNRAMTYTIQGTAPGNLELSNPDNDFGPIYATVDSTGSLEKFDLSSTTDKYIAERSNNLDVEGLAKSFAAREQAGKGIGVLSPRDTARIVMQGAHILVDYGRPAMRGRTIFGNVVPWNVVWRLGANAATQLVTNKTLAFGRTIVLPGTYSLFALPSEKGWKLIINYQHGQWGTVHDESKDLARLSLQTKRLTNAVEQFRFGLTGHGRSGVLSFKWENTEESIPFTVR